MKLISKFLWNFLVYIDLGLNLLLLGDPSETVSSRVGRAMESKRPKWFVPYLCKFIDTVFYDLFKQVNHSYNHIERDESFKLEIWSWIKK